MIFSPGTMRKHSSQQLNSGLGLYLAINMPAVVIAGVDTRAEEPAIAVNIFLVIWVALVNDAAAPDGPTGPVDL